METIYARNIVYGKHLIHSDVPDPNAAAVGGDFHALSVQASDNRQISVETSYDTASLDSTEVRQYCVGLWFKTQVAFQHNPNVGSVHRFFNHVLRKTIPNSDTIDVYVNSSGKWAIDGNGTTHNSTAAYPSDQGVWHHLALAMDLVAGRAYLYVDGAAVTGLHDILINASGYLNPYEDNTFRFSPIIETIGGTQWTPIASPIIALNTSTEKNIASDGAIPTAIYGLGTETTLSAVSAVSSDILSVYTLNGFYPQDTTEGREDSLTNPVGGGTQIRDFLDDRTPDSRDGPIKMYANNWNGTIVMNITTAQI